MMYQRALPFPVIIATCLILLAVSIVRLAAEAPREAMTGSVPPVTAAELLPGGAATARLERIDRDAFASGAGNLSADDRLRFIIGNAAFRKMFISAPADTSANDGLGPLFNARSCESCHVRDGRNFPSIKRTSSGSDTTTAVSGLPVSGTVVSGLAVHLSIPGHDDRLRAQPDPVYGLQLQDMAVAGHQPEGRLTVTITQKPVFLADSTRVLLRKPTYKIVDPGYGPLHRDLRLSPRVAPQMIGLGLLELVRDADILANADPDDANGDGISGRAHRVWTTHSQDGKARGKTVGRFGHKAGVATLRQQTAEALFADMGLSNRVRPEASGDCTPSQRACRSAPNGNTKRDNGFEVSDKLLDLLTFYSQTIAVPPRRLPHAPQVVAGRRLFHETGCAGCHRPSFKTRSGREPSDELSDRGTQGPMHLLDQRIWPYTDLLLHDMGPGLADNRSEGAASGREWRTAPLWGIGLTRLVTGVERYLHDGRAHSLTEAIMWHDGEAAAARKRFARLGAVERAKLLAFVRSL